MSPAGSVLSSASVAPGRRAAHRPLFGALVLLLAGCLWGCTRTGIAPPRHVFFISVDTLRADHLGFYGYARDTSPNLDRRAAAGTVFETAVAQWPKTGTSFAATFIGQYPMTTGLTHHGAIRVPESYLTLPESFRDHGYTTLAVVSNAVLSVELDWNRGFDEYLETWAEADPTEDDPIDFRRWTNARRVNEMAKPLLERHRDAEKLFVWLHYSDPHRPYVLPEAEENPFVGDELYVGDAQVEIKARRDRATRLGNHTDLKHYVAQYDANIRVVDEATEEILDWAEELGILENALVVFTADHGESLGEHGYFFGHGRLPFNDGARVPLVFFGPGIEARRVEAPVELLDVYPTLVELIAPNQPVPGLEGDSLVPLLTGTEVSPRTRFEFAFGESGGAKTHFRSAQDGRWKLIYHPPRERRSESWKLYDLRADPGETVDRLHERPPQLRPLKRALEEWMDGRTWIKPPRGQEVERGLETERALKALGYVQ